jgi:hypothetical protein
MDLGSHPDGSTPTNVVFRDGHSTPIPSLKVPLGQMRQGTNVMSLSCRHTKINLVTEGYPNPICRSSSFGWITIEISVQRHFLTCEVGRIEV